MDVVKDRIGLKQGAFGFSLFEVFGQLERNMLAQEKVADAMSKWEKYARSTHSPKTLKLTFKVQPARQLHKMIYAQIVVIIGSKLMRDGLVSFAFIFPFSSQKGSKYKVYTKMQ